MDLLKPKVVSRPVSLEDFNIYGMIGKGKNVNLRKLRRGVSGRANRK